MANETEGIPLDVSSWTREGGAGFKHMENVNTAARARTEIQLEQVGISPEDPGFYNDFHLFD